MGISSWFKRAQKDEKRVEKDVAREAKDVAAIAADAQKDIQVDQNEHQLIIELTGLWTKKHTLFAGTQMASSKLNQVVVAKKNLLGSIRSGWAQARQVGARSSNVAKRKVGKWLLDDQAHLVTDKVDARFSQLNNSILALQKQTQLEMVEAKNDEKRIQAVFDLIKQQVTVSNKLIKKYREEKKLNADELNKIHDMLARQKDELKREMEEAKILANLS